MPRNAKTAMLNTAHTVPDYLSNGQLVKDIFTHC